jgi:hypothetical protein
MGNLRYWFGNLEFDDDYTTNGEGLTPANVGMSVIDHLSLTPDTIGDSGTVSYLPVYDKSANKILLFNSAGDGDPLDEAGSSDDASDFFIYVAAWGKP